LRDNSKAWPVLKHFNVKPDLSVVLGDVLRPGPKKTADHIRDLLKIPAEVLDGAMKFALMQALLKSVCTQGVPSMTALLGMHSCFEQIASASAQELGAPSQEAGLKFKCDLFASIGAQDARWLGKTGMLLGVMMADPPEGHATGGAAMLKALGVKPEKVLDTLKQKADRRIGILHLQARDLLADAIKGHALLVAGSVRRAGRWREGLFGPMAHEYNGTRMTFEGIRMVFQDRVRRFGSDYSDEPSTWTREVEMRVMLLGRSNVHAEQEHKPWAGEWYLGRYGGSGQLYLEFPSKLEPVDAARAMRKLEKARTALGGPSAVTFSNSPFPEKVCTYTHGGVTKVAHGPDSDKPRAEAIVFRDEKNQVSHVHIHVFNGEPHEFVTPRKLLWEAIIAWKVSPRNVNPVEAAYLFGVMGRTNAELGDFLEAASKGPYPWKPPILEELYRALRGPDVELS
jgi:hypothetical protein